MSAKGLFSLPPRSTRAGDSIIAKKSSKPGRKGQTSGQVNIKGGGSILERIQSIVALVEKNLGQYRDLYRVIRNEEELIQYVDACIANNYTSLDTETTGLDPITNQIAGLCLYTRGEKSTYIPMHHVSYVTGVEVADQLSDEIVARELGRIRDAGIYIDTFNGKFDVRVCSNQLGVDLRPSWDSYIGARLLNENEGDGLNKLKLLHRKYCRNGVGDAFTFDDLFRGIPFSYIPINTAYLYAAHDPVLTMELGDFQRQYLTVDGAYCKEQGLEQLAFVMNSIEIPLLPVVARMEDTGVAIDLEYLEQLSKKYNKMLEDKAKEFYAECDKFGTQLDAYRAKMGAKNKLEYPINIASSQQIAIMIYDILGIEQPKLKNKSPRSVDEDILSRIDHPVVKSILSYREANKLIGTYIDNMFALVNEKTGRIHGGFNQVGTRTGRFSSSEPNMQNIPAHNKDIRPMFTATKDYVMMSADYSAQEPRITAHMSQDKRMIQAYLDGKDLYCEIASIAFGVPYEECQEFRADGTKNSEGKERRGRAKAIVLGVCYGKGVAAIAEDLKVSVKLAQEIYDTIMREFPGLQQFMEDSQTMAKDLGFVTTMFGRKRRLPDIQLPKYEFRWMEGYEPPNFDPLGFDEEVELDTEVPLETQDRYTRLLDRCYNRKDKNGVYAKAKSEGIIIKDNGGYIAQATRQCVNSRIQGSAGDQIKMAMILVGNDEELQSYGFRMILQVHDELIGECPKETAEKAAERFKYLMEIAIKDYLSVPSKCDIEITDRWFGKKVEFLPVTE